MSAQPKACLQCNKPTMHTWRYAPKLPFIDACRKGEPATMVEINLHRSCVGDFLTMNPAILLQVKHD